MVQMTFVERFNRYVSAAIALHWPMVLACLILTSVNSKASLALDLFAEALPQAQTNTCQSYAIMLALAAKGDSRFPIVTFAQLRQAEARFRQLAEKAPGGPYGHVAFQSAVRDYTGGAYELVIETTHNDIVKWLGRVKELTTLHSSRDALIAKLTKTHFPVVLTSVTKLGSSTYDGHLIAVLGVVGSGLNSSTEVLTFNSAIKGQNNTINRCEPGMQPGDMRYQAGVISTNDFSIKSYPGLRIFYLRQVR